MSIYRLLRLIDDLGEGIETITLRFTTFTAANEIILQETAEILELADEIDDRNISLSISASTPSTNEGNIVDFAQFTFNLDNAQASTLTINYDINGDATSSLDYKDIPNNIVIGSGVTFTTLSIESSDDQVAEGNETVEIAILADSLESLPGITLTVTTATAFVTIIDNDTAITVAVSVFDATADEADGNLGIYHIEMSSCF